MKANQKAELTATMNDLKGKGATREELEKLIKKDPTKPNAAEQKEILDEVFKELNQGNGNTPQNKPATAFPAVIPAQWKGKGAAPSPSIPPTGNVKDVPTVTNESIAAELAEIDFANLKGDMMKKYVELVGDRSYTEIKDGQVLAINGKLLQSDEYVFELKKAKPIMQARYVGVEGSPFDYVGLEIINDKPEHTTKIPVKMAIEYNAQILNQHSRAGHGKYYFLKK